MRDNTARTMTLMSCKRSIQVATSSFIAFLRAFSSVSSWSSCVPTVGQVVTLMYLMDVQESLHFLGGLFSSCVDTRGT